jgi:hypothetical protein
LREHGITMAEPAHAELTLLPGEQLVLFLIRMEQKASVVAVTADRFLEGLRAACSLMSFTVLCRDEPALDELLPWAGSV